MRFWGWGEDGRGRPLPDHALDLLRSELGALTPLTRVAAIGDVRVPASALGDGAARDALAAAAPVRDDHEARVLHAAGKGLPDLLRLRAGDAGPAPDAVVSPADAAGAAAVLKACARHRIAVVPFGGGTSVVGGVEPDRGSCEAVVALDTRVLGGVEVDARSLLARAGAGLLLPELEQALGARGVTLGHFPQSYEHATIGGCVATRSAGQASTGYGRIDEAVAGVRLVAPAGRMALPALPASAAGPALRELLVGSEGALGVVTDATLRVHPLPSVRRYEGLFFASFAEGLEAYRRAVQLGAAPDVARLSDESETRLSMTLASSGGAKDAIAKRYLALRGVGEGCVAIVGWEGERDDVARRRARSLAVLRAGGAVGVGASPGRAWEHGRYEGPYLRDELLDAGVLVETLETAHTWTGVEDLYRAVGKALRGALGRCLVMCHVSHLYESGCSLYFTWLTAARPGAELEQWRTAKQAAGDAIVAAGGTITHHHAIGRDHVPWLRHEASDLGLDALRAAKERLDPAGIMNPGKLLAP